MPSAARHRPLSPRPSGTHAAFDDYKALVCVFLFGGNDSFNMVVPRSDLEYNEYAAARQNLAIARSSLLPLNPLVPDPGGALYGLHPSLAEIAALFEQDEACAIVANVGPLIEPTTKTQFLAKSVRLPPQLFSHNDQQDQWHALKGEAMARSGWGGRIADVIASSAVPMPLDQPLAVNLSLSGQSLFQTGATSVPYTMGPTGPVQLFGLDGTDPLSIARRAAFDAVIGANYPTVYERAYARVQQRARQAAGSIGDALASVRSPNAAPFTTTFPASPLGTQLRTVAELIAARDQLQVNRQIFFVATGGFDTHDAQVADQPGLLANISRSLAAFYRATAEMGVASEVDCLHAVGFRPHADVQRRRHGSRLGRQPARHRWRRRGPHDLRPLSAVEHRRPGGRRRRAHDPGGLLRPIRGNARRVVRRAGCDAGRRCAAYRQFRAA